MHLRMEFKTQKKHYLWSENQDARWGDWAGVKTWAEMGRGKKKMGRRARNHRLGVETGMDLHRRWVPLGWGWERVKVGQHLGGWGTRLVLKTLNDLSEFVGGGRRSQQGGRGFAKQFFLFSNGGLLYFRSLGVQTVKSSSKEKKK